MRALVSERCSVLSVSYRLALAFVVWPRPVPGFGWRAVLVGLERTPTPPGFRPGRPWWRWTFGFVRVYRGGSGGLEDAALDVALRMPRGAVERRKGRLRSVPRMPRGPWESP